MGMTLSRIVIAVNENDEFPQFLSSGDFTPISPSRQCLSNAMNVGNPSNLARYFDLYNGHLLSNGIVKKKPDLSTMKEKLWSTSVSDLETIQTIKDTWSDQGIILDPHGAVGLAALQKFRAKNKDNSDIKDTERNQTEGFSGLIFGSMKNMLTKYTDRVDEIALTEKHKS